MNSTFIKNGFLGITLYPELQYLGQQSAEDKTVQNQPNASETLAVSDQPSASGKKK